MQQPLRQQNFHYDVRRTARKTLGIYVYRDGRVEVRIPKNTPLQEMLEFVDAQRPWVLKQLAKQSQMPKLPSLAFEHGAQHYFLGEPHFLHLEDQPAEPLHRVRSIESTSCADLPRNALSLPVRSGSDQGAIKEALKKWYREQARVSFSDSLDRQHQRLNRVLTEARLAPVKRPQLKIRAMKTRWGSCSSSGNVNLNLWLVRLPEPIIDYVVAHELCHLVEFNHGPEFYHLLDALAPDWREAKQTLEQHPASGAGF